MEKTNPTSQLYFWRGNAKTMEPTRSAQPVPGQLNQSFTSYPNRQTLKCSNEPNPKIEHNYFTATVIPTCVVTPPIVNCSACAPGANPAGTTTFIWNTPDTSVGADPMYWIAAARLPIMAEDAASGCRKSVLMILPSWPGGLVCPSPVP